MTQKRPAALITGASSGIGAAFARKLASMGYDLVLTGRREKLLEDLCAKLSTRHGILAGYMIAELADESRLREIEDTIRRMPNLRILINNAGYTRLELFAEDSIDAQVDMIKVHDIAAVRLTHAAIPVLRTHNWGAVINVSSIAAFLIGARNLMYDATKGFLLSFSSSLHLELGGTGIRVQALCPGFTRTDFHAKLGYGPEHPIFRQRRFMSADKVVQASLACLERGKVICIPGRRNRRIAFICKRMPRKLFYLLYAKRRLKKKRG